MPKFHSKMMTEVEAFCYDGTPRTALDILQWMKCRGGEKADGLRIEAPTGPLHISPGDWIVKDASGRFHAYLKETFAAFYTEERSDAQMEEAAATRYPRDPLQDIPRRE